MRICITGPTPPYRSGISRHTHALATALTKIPGVEVEVFSFSRQYPKLFYPGADDRDPGLAPPETYPCHYTVDTLNPASWIETASRIDRAEPDLVLIPAWTFFTAPCLEAIARWLEKRGRHVRMIVHNAADHESSKWKAALLKRQLQAASSFIVHNRAMANDLKKIADKPVIVSPLPLFDDYPPPLGLLPRERDLELLFFGVVRPYKGLDIAIKALAASGLENVRLSVVGEFWSGRKEIENLIETLDLGDRIEMVAEFVSDRTAAEYFARCDAVIASYRRVTGSAVVALAQHYRRPVIASDLPGFREALTHGKTGWLFENENANALAELLRNDVTRASAERMRPDLEAQSCLLSWDRYARAAIDREVGLLSSIVQRKDAAA